MDQEGKTDISGSVGAGSAIGAGSRVYAKYIAGGDIYFNVPRPTPPPKPKLFIGRSIETKKLERLLINNRAQNVTVLSGPRGVGKTTLAATVSNRLLSQFPDCLWADMAEYRKEPLTLLKRFIKQLGHSADELDNPNSASVFLSSIVKTLHVLFVLDNVEQLEELKYFLELINGTQASMLVITGKEELGKELTSEILILHPLREDHAVSLFQKISKLSSSKRRESIRKIIHFCHRLPGLICPIASQIKEAGENGLENWELQAEHSQPDLESPDVSAIFRSLYRDLSEGMKLILRTAVILTPAKLSKDLLLTLFRQESQELLDVFLQELTSLRFLRKIEADVFEPDFLLKANHSYLSYNDSEYERLYVACHTYFVAQVSQILSAERKTIAEAELNDAKIFFEKTVADEKWQLVREYNEIARNPNFGRLSIRVTGDSMLYGFESIPFLPMEIYVKDSKVIRINAPGGIGESVYMKNASAFFLNFKGSKLESVHIADSVAGHISLEGSTIETVYCADCTLSNLHLRGAQIKNLHIRDTKISALDLQAAKIENFHIRDTRISELDLQAAKIENFHIQDTVISELQLQTATVEKIRIEDSTGWAINMSRGRFEEIVLENSELFDIRFEEAVIEEFVQTAGILTSPDTIQVNGEFRINS